MTLKELYNITELQFGMTILTVDLGGNESLEKVIKIDTNYIYTYGLADEKMGQEPIWDYFQHYSAIYELIP